ncbi:MAG: hypothetical protein SGCHY_000980 [Lobulomycetales sp.]
MSKRKASESSTGADGMREVALILPQTATLHEPRSQSSWQRQDDSISMLFAQDYSTLPLKPDHATRPLWVCHDGKIILEAFSPLADQAQDFLITISEPVSRPMRMHEYKLTPYSLYAAVAVGMETATIIQVLERFSKSKVPDEVIKFIRDCTVSYGKVKLVLKLNRYFVESNYPDIIRRLLNDSVLKQALISDTQLSETGNPAETSAVTIKEEANAFTAIITVDQEDERDEDPVDHDGAQPSSSAVKAEGETDFTSSFEIHRSMVEDVRKRCVELDYPLTEEYDFRGDTANASLEIDLSPKCIIRDYQEKSLSKMFGGGGGRARSGIIVLPTGAGKTLVGITAACTVKKNTLILCTNALSVEQWANELRHWSSIKAGQIAKFTADQKARFSGDGTRLAVITKCHLAGIVISTYTMIAHSGKRAWETQQMLSFINSVDWGLMILDEVHVVPANVFRRVLTTVAAHTKLGLTATLVREDDKIEDLNFLIGPKLYEANWMDLAGKGHIAKVEATEIWCPMTGDFYKEYLAANKAKQRLLCVMNPSKFMACQYLIRWREREDDKIIVFSDNVFALTFYARAMNKPFLYGGTHHEERSKVLSLFRQGHPDFKTVFLSKVGDTSLDLPEATCLIQISSQFGSRRQEAQRMGRILRAKRRNEAGFRSRFYTLVSRDTDEVAFSSKRKRFLIDQGYEFRVLHDFSAFIPPEQAATLKFSTRTEQEALLRTVLRESDASAEEEVLNTALDDIAGEWQKQQSGSKKKKKTGKPADGRAGGARKNDGKKMNPLFRAWLKK